MPEPNDEAGGSVPRAFWSGTVSFGLVSIPVALLPANRAGGVALRMLTPDGTPVARRYVCPRDERPLDDGEIVRGYEVRKGKFVVVTDEELEALEPKKSRDIDLRQFAPTDSIDPLYFEHAYYLVPAGQSTKAYTLLARIMEDRDRAGIATFVMRGKEYLVAILAERGILRAETLRFHDEVRRGKDVVDDVPAEPPASRVRKLAQAIRKLSHSGLPRDALEDRYAERVVALARRKRARHEDVVEAEPVESGDDDRDLVEALRSALRGGSRRAGPARRAAGKRAGRGRTPTRGRKRRAARQAK